MRWSRIIQMSDLFNTRIYGVMFFRFSSVAYEILLVWFVSGVSMANRESGGWRRDAGDPSV